MSAVASFACGPVTVTVLNLGHLRGDLATWFDLPPAAHPLLEKPQRLPLQCVLIQGAAFTLLVDAPAYDLAPDSEFALPGYLPPPNLTTQLLAIGVQPEAVTHVVITHAHFDHFNGLARLEDGQLVPAFPRAHVYLGQRDWESPDLQAKLARPDSLEARILGLMANKSRLSLVQGDRDLGHGLRVVSAPGETPGHQLLRLAAGQRVLYAIGDLFHHVLEIRHPDWMVAWADAAVMRRSQQALLSAALAEKAWLVATHIPGVGRLHQTSAGIEWELVAGN